VEIERETKSLILLYFIPSAHTDSTMDVAYKQHATRRHNRSATNLNHLTLAPLTSKLPLTDPEDLPDFVASPAQYNVSYLQGKSAPATPRLLAGSPARGNSRTRSHAISTDTLPKSKSASHLAGIGGAGHQRHQHRHSGAMTPTSARRRKDEHWSVQMRAEDRSDSDWMLRAGALISIETRESKGQAWLVSRQSSTSLTGLRDPDEEALEREAARERELASRRSSRRGSLANNALDDLLVTTASPTSHLGSRSHSRRGSRTVLPRTPLDQQRHHDDGGYFVAEHVSDEYLQGPDFVSLDEKLEAIEIDTSEADEATVRRLVKRENINMGSWMGKLVGWSLFSVDEDEEESDEEDDVEGASSYDGEGDEGGHMSRSSSVRHFEGVTTVPEPRIPPPKEDEGGWQDAAWLLSVASKVLL
jgi:hypothetical protein